MAYALNEFIDSSHCVLNNIKLLPAKFNPRIHAMSGWAWAGREKMGAIHSLGKTNGVRTPAKSEALVARRVLGTGLVKRIVQNWFVPPKAVVSLGS